MPGMQASTAWLAVLTFTSPDCVPAATVVTVRSVWMRANSAGEPLPVVIVAGGGGLAVVLVGIERAVAIRVLAEEKVERGSVNESHFIDGLEGRALVVPRRIALRVVVFVGGGIRIVAAPRDD